MDNFAFFCQIQEIPDNLTVFEELKNKQLFFSYFQVDQNYYLFLYGQESIDIEFLYQSVDVIQELDKKKRAIRSLRGFFLYALEIMDNRKVQILKTNLQPSFWRQLKKILEQNKKKVILQFLFGSQQESDVEEKIQNLETLVSSLQQKVIQLEAKLMTVEQNSKYALSELLKASKDMKTIQQGDYILKENNSSYLAENDSQVRDSTSWGKDMKSKSFSEAPRSSLNTLSNNQQYNLSSNQEIATNSLNFITLGNLSEDEKIEIIQTGFQLQAQGKISLKKYYETTYPNSLFQLKGYNIKYESIRRSKLYQNLKE